MFLFLLFLISHLHAETDLNDIFSVQNNPTMGTLTYKQGEKIEMINFGNEGGYYALGMIFTPNSLPNSYKNDFKSKKIIQLVFGTLKARFPNQVPQFGSGTLMTGSLPNKRTFFKLNVPSGKSSDFVNAAFLMFTLPSTPLETSDEQKLKMTYFAKTGSVFLTPNGKPTVYEMKSAQTSNSTANFKMQTMTLEISSTLISPFNPEEHSIEAKLDLPIFWPDGPTAEKYAREIAGESLETTRPLPPAQGLTDHKEDVAGSTKKLK